jgi:alpha-D-xyloside xylohydrolase
MKFSHGVWTMREGVTPLYPLRVHEQRQADGELQLICVNRPAEQMLNNYALVVGLSSPLPGVIRIRVRHLLGQKARPRGFDLDYGLTNAQARFEEHGSKLRYMSGDLSLEVDKERFSFELRRGSEILTASRHNQLGLMTLPGGEQHVMQRLSLGVGEQVYGLGERFGPLAKNGQSIEIWNEDPGTGTELAYKSIPFYVTNRGYGVLVNHPGRVDFEVATERVSQVQFSVRDHELDYYVFAGSSPKDVLDLYTRLAGRPALPPAWSFGLWLSTSFTTSYDEATVMEMLDGMRDRKLPLSVFHFDCRWMREHHWCDFEWDPAKFPDPQGMLARLKARGLKTCVWINPYISEVSSLFAEGRDAGYFLKDAQGNVYQRYDWQPGIALVDFTNPAATSWYLSKLRRLLEQGVDCFKTDFGERIPKDAVYHDGSDPERLHNYYAYLYNQAVFGLLEEFHGKGQAAVFARSACAGSQKFPVHWGGDCDATFESMAETLRGGLSFGLSGGAFWSHDISGFNDTASPALYKRWVAFGLLSSHSRLHGNSSYRVPWRFDEEAVDVLHHFTQLKQRLMPYIWSQSVEATRTGAPLLRATVLEFPQDPAAPLLDRQYLLGPSLLVAPVLSESGDVTYYLPPGTWTDLLTGERREGGCYVCESRTGFLRVPLWVRAGTLLVTSPHADRPDHDATQDLRLQPFELAEGARVSAEVFSPDAERQVRFEAQREGQQLRLRVASGSPPSGARYALILPGGREIPWESPNRELVINLS